MDKRPIKAEIERITMAGLTFAHFNGVSWSLASCSSALQEPGTSLLNINIRIDFGKDAALSPDA